MRRIAWLFVIFVGSLVFPAGSAHAQKITLDVDLTDAPRNIFHEHLIVPANPGPMTLVYPKWIPGNHRPSGPITNLVGIKFSANIHALSWERDPIDMYAFHVMCPAECSRLTYRWIRRPPRTARDPRAQRLRPTCLI